MYVGADIDMRLGCGFTSVYARLILFRTERETERERDTEKTKGATVARWAEEARWSDAVVLRAKERMDERGR